MLIGYMRISTEKDTQTTDLQRDSLLAAGVDERHLFEDRASGLKDDRPGLIEALSYAREGDCLVVWKLDRLGRSLPHLVSIMVDLKQKGVSFRSLTENIDTTTPLGKLFFGLSASFSEYEQSLARERIIAGLEAARKRGRIGGREKVITGERLEAILEDIKRGTSKVSICRKFMVKRSTLYYALKNHEIESAA